MEPKLPWESLGQPKSYKKVGVSIDLRRCVGCHACSVACKTEHSVELGQFYMRTHALSHPTKTGLSFVPTMCMHCEDAPCVTACGSKAISRKEDGRIVIDDNRCDGSKACISACPYGAIAFDTKQNKAHKCDLCENRTSQGLDPACMDVCPTEAIVIGDLEDKSSPLNQRNASAKATALKAELGLKPRVNYLGHESWMDERVPGVQLQEGEEGIIYEQ